MKVQYRNILKGRHQILAYVKEQKDQSKFKVIDIGGVVNGWTKHIADVVADINSADFKLNVSNEDDWQALLDIVQRDGKFDYCICTHVAEDVSNPQLLFRMLPKIAMKGVLTMPSVVAELSRLEAPEWLGFCHHRHIFDVQDDVIVIAPKLSFLEVMVGKGYDPKSSANSPWGEIAIEWEEEIPFKMIMNDYLGPSVHDVMTSYKKFIKCAEDKILTDER